MKKGCLLSILGTCFVLCLGCGGFLSWGLWLNYQEAKRDYDAAGQLWASGQKAEAAEKYKAVKQDYLGKDEVAVVKQRLHDFAVEQAKAEKDAGDQDWAAGKKDEAAAHYRSIQLDLLEPDDRETVKQRIKEVDTATAKKDLEEGNTLWESGDTAKAAEKYDGIPVDLLDPAAGELVTRRLYESANRQWDDGRKAEAAARYKRLHPTFLAGEDQQTVARRVKESDETEKKYTSAASSEHGKKVQLDRLELYFTPAISQTEARKLGDYLEKTHKDLDHNVTAQITKQGKTYQYRVVVKKGIELDEEAVAIFKKMALQLSLFVFDGADVEIHLCDDQLKTLRVVIPFNKN